MSSTQSTRIKRGQPGYVSPLKGKRSPHASDEHMRRMRDKVRRIPLADRFWSYVEKTDGCWIWRGAVLVCGHGQVWANGRMRKAHHIALELAGINPYQPGKVVDHTCMNALCVNPAHLRFVSPRVNSLENNRSPFARNAGKTHCAHGHEFNPENTALMPKTKRRNRHGKLVSSSRPTRMCLTCFPFLWRHAQVPRPRPPGSKYKPTDPDYDQRPRKGHARGGFK